MTVLKKPWPRRRSRVRHGNLRHKADDPHQQRVAEVFRQIGAEQLGIILKPHEIGADLLQAAAEIFKKTVIYRGGQRDELEHRKGDEKRGDEKIAPFGVADGAVLSACRARLHIGHLSFSEECGAGVARPARLSRGYVYSGHTTSVSSGYFSPMDVWKLVLAVSRSTAPSK